MKNKILYTLIFILVYTLTYGQSINLNDTEYLTKFRDIAFVANDTVLKYTLFIEQNGDFYFSKGRLDSSYTEGGVMYWINDKRQTTTAQQLKYVKSTSEVDTIINCFVTNTDNYDEKLNLEFLKFSYIIEHFGESCNIEASEKEVIRLLYPCKDINQVNEYCYVKIKLGDNNNAELYSWFGNSINFDGFKVFGNNTLQLKKRELKKINKLLYAINTNNNKYCVSPGNPWLLELNFNRVYSQNLISYYCFRTNKELGKIVKVYYLIRGINERNFNTCSK